MDSLKVSTTDLLPGISRVSIEGTVDPSNAGIMKNAIDALFARGVYKLVMDLKGARYISSTGIGCFITSLDVATGNGGQIAFIAADHQIQRIAQILMLSDVFLFVDDEKAAIELLNRKK